ncbi:MAG: hypothetical protein LH603_19715 [Pseudonocardia sp.]|nr:hypothetical protein [Pseudonocardia sp.]
MAVRRRGVPLVHDLSLPGLDDAIERGVRDDLLRDNFPRLAAAGIPIVHYWRPGIPASATAEVMERSSRSADAALHTTKCGPVGDTARIDPV